MITAYIQKDGRWEQISEGWGDREWAADLVLEAGWEAASHFGNGDNLDESLEIVGGVTTDEVDRGECGAADWVVARVRTGNGSFDGLVKVERNGR